MWSSCMKVLFENDVNFMVYIIVLLKALLVELLKDFKRPVQWKIKKVKNTVTAVVHQIY